jgi:catalase-peroxidase
MNGVNHGRVSHDWWPGALNLEVLAWNPVEASPLGRGFDYGRAVEALDLGAVKADIATVLTSSRDWWPADFGTYAPLFVRMTWHAAGTYRLSDGRGGGGTGQQRFAPLNSWPDNVNLDKARRLLWPVKKKYGRCLSWADLLILAGHVALESMGVALVGFAGGRPDVWEPEEVYWGHWDTGAGWLGGTRHTVERDLAATQLGLVYVNPEGPGGDPDPLAAAAEIKETFTRMGMTLEETVALIAGGHTFGKAHGARPDDKVGPDPEAAPLERQGLGWANGYGTGAGPDALTSGLEVTWTYHPTRWDNEFFHILYSYEWELTTSPAGGKQWRPKNNGGDDLVQAAFGRGRTSPAMLTTDLALRFDPELDAISRTFKDDHKALGDAFARAWFKLTHRALGPKSRYRGSQVPAEDFLWQDPVPAGVPVPADQVASVKQAILAAGLTVSQLVKTAWAAASTYRRSDHRGGLNGARIALEPQKSWDVNEPAELATVLAALRAVKDEFGISLADAIALGGAAAVERAAAAAGFPVTVRVTTGRGDATQEQTDVESFEYLRPRADGFRNYLGKDSGRPLEHALVDRASLLGLTAPELTVLIGGLRVLGANHGGSRDGVFTDAVGVLSNDWFASLLEPGTEWHAADARAERFAGTASDGRTWTATRNDLLFAANSELRALAEVYAADDAGQKFATDFAAAFAHVLDADRFDLR